MIDDILGFLLFYVLLVSLVVSLVFNFIALIFKLRGMSFYEKFPLFSLLADYSVFVIFVMGVIFSVAFCLMFFDTGFL